MTDQLRSGGPVMDWTEDRVATLKKLYFEGLSCSQIAKQLGGVTRNAVIGKIHRIGLSGRATPSLPSRPMFRPTHPSRPPKPAAATTPRQPRLPTPTAAPYVDIPGTATIYTLGSHMCKWPIGDPSTDDFSYCGRRCGDGPYCIEHARVAYQPVQRKKGPHSGTELARSLRRYI